MAKRSGAPVARLVIGHWSLVIPWALDIGHWSFFCVIDEVEDEEKIDIKSVPSLLSTPLLGVTERSESETDLTSWKRLRMQRRSTKPTLSITRTSASGANTFFRPTTKSSAF